MNNIRRLCGLLFLLVILAPFFTASATTITGRIDYAIAYFPPANAVILHGGWGPTSDSSTNWKPRSEMWRLDEFGWSPVSAADSPAMAHHSMAYDSDRQVLVLCGRVDAEDWSSFTYQTWEYNGTGWVRKPDIPFAFMGDLEVVYDKERHVTVLYAAGYEAGLETYEYDGTSWTRKMPAHQPVATGDGALMKYDEVNKKTVLVGAVSGTTETWLWDGTDWTKVQGTQPANALTGGMAFDSGKGEMVLLTTDMQTWTFDGTSWSRKAPVLSPSPSPMGFFAMAYDPIRQTSLFFGGEQRLSEPPWGYYPLTTWQWNGTTWSVYGIAPGWNFISFPKQPPNPDVGTALAELSSVVVVIWGWDGSNQAWKKWTPSGGAANTLTALEPGRGYWLYASGPGSLNTATWTSPPLTNIFLTGGWNLTGYFGPQRTGVATFLNSIQGKWIMLWTWHQGQWYGKHETGIILPAPIQSLSVFIPGKAYWIRMKQGQTTAVPQ